MVALGWWEISDGFRCPSLIIYAIAVGEEGRHSAAMMQLSAFGFGGTTIASNCGMPRAPNTQSEKTLKREQELKNRVDADVLWPQFA